ncbi:MAG: RHS repeat-associated core domain-containing protein [Candidatus Acidiferrales bacterium]
MSQSVTSSNQFSGFCYDAAGNLLAETAAPCPSPTYNYNAKNQLTSTAGVSYLYDPTGSRVEKSSGTLYWYGPDNNVLEETNLSGGLVNEYVFFGGQRIGRRDYSNNVYYYATDHLGTSRVMAEVPSGSTTATLCYDADFYPFGGERAYTNTCAQNYKFTGKERDSESNLDNFGARYNSSSMGRFMSPDPLAGHTEDPQTLNRYVYVRDNPLSLTDPTGLDFYLSCQKASDTCQKDSAGNLVQDTTTTTTDANGNKTSNFTATVVTSASLQDPNSGNTATVNQNGVQITTANGTAEGIFINKTPAANIQGSGDLSGFAFNINSSNEKIGTLDAGTYTYEGSRDQAGVVKVLTDRGAFSYPGENSIGNPWHPGDLNFRFSSGAHPELFDYGPSPHILVPNDPAATVPVGPGYDGQFHVDSHTGALSHGSCAVFHAGCQ